MDAKKLLFGFAALLTFTSAFCQHRQASWHCKDDKGNAYLEGGKMKVGSIEFVCTCQTKRTNSYDKCLSYAWETSAKMSPVPSGTNIAADEVAFFEHCNFEGRRTVLKHGYAINCLDDPSIWHVFTGYDDVYNDEISSIFIPSGMGVWIYEDKDFSGNKKWLTNSVKCLTDINFNDKVTSMQVGKVVVENNTPKEAKPIYIFDRSKTPGGPRVIYILEQETEYLNEQEFECEKSKASSRAVIARKCMEGDVEACTTISSCYDWCASVSEGDNKNIYITASDAMQNLGRSWREYKNICDKKGKNSTEAKTQLEAIKHMIEMNKVIFNIDHL